ncbi:hypothetical protein BYT27DRAFT_7252658 [Phlegmacium glaucopus]|nr:hypothetical protein BYT27DRAFT_7252658 [Phlegmacium glaucopus]
MPIIPSLVLVVSVLAQVTVLAVPVPVNRSVSIHGHASSLDDEASQMLATRTPQAVVSSGSSLVGLPTDPVAVADHAGLRLEISTTSCILKKSAIFIHNACLQHRYIRSKNTLNIVERPERLRAVTIGLFAAIARMVSSTTTPGHKPQSASPKREPDPKELTDVMNKLKIDSELSTYQSPVAIIESQAMVDILNHPAESLDKISEGESEIPEGLSQGDLYLCPGSITAMQGAIGTVCEAVDKVILSSRVPCGYHDPSRLRGHSTTRTSMWRRHAFWIRFFNNVAIGTAHAHLQHGIKVGEGWWNVENLIKLEAATTKRHGGRPSLPTPSSTDPWLERAMAIFTPLDGSMTLRNRTKGKNLITISSSLSANDTKLMTGNTVGDDQKYEESASSAGKQSSVEDGHRSSSLSSTEDKKLTTKGLPRVILRLGKPPDPSVLAWSIVLLDCIRVVCEANLVSKRHYK